MEEQKKNSIKLKEYRENIKKRNRAEKIFNIVLLFSVLFGLLMLTVLIIDIAVEGSSWLRPELFTNYHSRKPEECRHEICDCW